jgi:hypothetical protein
MPRRTAASERKEDAANMHEYRRRGKKRGVRHLLPYPLEFPELFIYFILLLVIISYSISFFPPYRG